MRGREISLVIRSVDVSPASELRDNKVMSTKSFTPKWRLLLMAGLLAGAGSVAASAEERLPWLRDPPPSERTYAQAGDVDRNTLPPAQGAEPESRPGYGSAPPYNSAPRPSESGYDRSDDTYHPPAQNGGGFGSGVGQADRRNDAYYPPSRSDSYGSSATAPRDDAYHPPARGDAYGGSRPAYGQDDTYRPPSRIQPYEPPRTYGRDDAYHPPSRGHEDYASPSSQYAAPYPPPASDEPEWRDDRGRPPPPGPDRYASAAPPYDDREPPPTDGTYSMREIVDTGRGFFGSVSRGLASVIEYAFKTQGRPNGYILGEDAGGAFVAGLRYGEGRLYTRDAGTHRVFWQGPSLGYDVGAEGSKVMVLVYNLRDPSDIYHRFGGVAGSAYVVGGVGMTFQQRNDVVLAPIRAGMGLRLGANVGYLKYTRRPTWNPF